MKVILRSALVLAPLMLLVEATAGSASLITYRIRSGNQDLVMVMDNTGADPTEAYRSPKFGGVGDFTISPPGPNGTWIAMDLFEGLFKVRADGTGLIKVLCSPGTDADGAAYYLSGRQQWSPDGTEILVDTGEYLALIPADFAAGPGTDCSSPLVPIFCYDCGLESGWTFEGTAAWNHDGSKIAFFEFSAPPEEGGDVRLVILERQGTDWTIDRYVPLVPRPAPSISFLFELDWQRGENGSVLAFVSREETGRRPNFWLTWIDINTGNWDFFREGSNRLEGLSPSWSPVGQQLIFSNSQGSLVKWDYGDGSGEILGSGEAPDWQRNQLLVSCGSDSECSDGNPCTNDLCDVSTGECSNPAFPENTACGINGGCSSGTCIEPECGMEGQQICDDLNECTIDSCSGYQCISDPGAAAGLLCDDGDDCTGNDKCDGAGGCAGTADPAIPGCQTCLPKRDACSSDSECCSNNCRRGKCR